jgi:hypothetical protein
MADLSALTSFRKPPVILRAWSERLPDAVRHLHDLEGPIEKHVRGSDAEITLTSLVSFLGFALDSTNVTQGRLISSDESATLKELSLGDINDVILLTSRWHGAGINLTRTLLSLVRLFVLIPA